MVNRRPGLCRLSLKLRVSVPYSVFLGFQMCSIRDRYSVTDTFPILRTALALYTVHCIHCGSTGLATYWRRVDRQIDVLDAVDLLRLPDLAVVWPPRESWTQTLVRTQTQGCVEIDELPSTVLPSCPHGKGSPETVPRHQPETSQAPVTNPSVGPLLLLPSHDRLSRATMEPSRHGPARRLKNPYQSNGMWRR